MRFSVKYSLILATVILVLGSCSGFKRLEKSEDWRIKYEAGLNYYNKKDYYRSAVLFEQIQPIVRGLPEGEKVEFYLAYCQYNEKTYLLASNQFKIFYETYGRSALRVEAQFMYAYSLFIASPDYLYDQASSLEAMQAMQTFVNQHGESEFREKALNVIQICEEKQEMKGYTAAKQYLKLGYYQAAIVSFDNFKKHFPDSKHLEELTFLKITAIYKLAEVSIYYRQVERYKTTMDYYQNLIDSYPNSLYAREAERMFTDAKLKLSKLKPNS